MEDAENIENLERQLNDATRMLAEAETVVEEPAVVETVVEPVAKEEPLKPDEEEVPHGEKSRLGRKVKRLEDTLDQIKSSLDFLKERTVQPVQHQAAPEPELPDDATPEEIRDYIKQREDLLIAKVEARQNERTQKSQDAVNQYVRKYSQLVKKTLDEEDPEESEIFNLMTAEGEGGKATEYNRSYSNFQDPEEDFRINFKAATRAIINKTKPLTKTTVHNAPSKIPTGVNVPGNGKPPARAVDISSWSAEEQSLAKHFSGDELANMGIL
jgi:hypothetical protein